MQPLIRVNYSYAVGLVKGNVCNCVPKQHKHSYSILPYCVGFVIVCCGGLWYFSMCTQERQQFYFSMQLENVTKMYKFKTTICESYKCSQKARKGIFKPAVCIGNLIFQGFFFLRRETTMGVNGGLN